MSKKKRYRARCRIGQEGRPEGPNGHAEEAGRDEGDGGDEETEEGPVRQREGGRGLLTAKAFVGDGVLAMQSKSEPWWEQTTEGNAAEFLGRGVDNGG